MPEKKDPNKIAGQLEDEEILELADEVLKASDNDEIVELTDLADPPDSEDEEEIIDLSEVADIPLEEDEEIMDLTDSLDESPGIDEGITELSDIAAESPPLEEEVIDLDDYVDEAAAGEEEIFDLEDMEQETPEEISEAAGAAKGANDAEALELTESDREAIAEEMSLDLDAGPLEDTVELTDEPGPQPDEISAQPKAQQPLEDALGLPDQDAAAEPTETPSQEAENGESDTVELTELDSETLDKELGELSLDLEDARQTETAEVAPDQELSDSGSFMEDDSAIVDDTVEMGDVGQTPPEAQEDAGQVRPASMENLEFTAADEEIIDEELSLGFDKEPQTEAARFEEDAESSEQELSFDAETLAEDTQVTGVESQLRDDDDKQPGIEEPSTAGEEFSGQGGHTQEEELGLDFDKEENLADSLGMTLDSEMDAPEGFTETQEPDDIYKTQEILNEISQFDTVEKSSLHKQTDPISIRVQDPAVENRLEIDSLEQDATAGVGTIAPEQIDAAVERVVKRMFSEKIESILVQVIERTVTKEINRIKNILLDETSGDV